jgi:hypothetical protein
LVRLRSDCSVINASRWNCRSLPRWRLGILQAQLCPRECLRTENRHLRGLTSSPFGVNFVLHFPHEEGIRVCIEERVAALSLFWGDPTPFVEPAHRAGVSIMMQVSRWGTPFGPHARARMSS